MNVIRRTHKEPQQSGSHFLNTYLIITFIGIHSIIIFYSSQYIV